MRPDDVKVRVEHIAAAAGDPEVAHAMEDALYRDVLMWIASGGDRAQELAAEAVKSRDINFPRWCA